MKKNKILSAFLSLSLSMTSFAVVPVTASAAETTTTAPTVIQTTTVPTNNQTTTKPPETTTPTTTITTKEVQEGAFTAVINVRAADTGETLKNVDVAFVEYDADLMVNPDAKIIRTIAEWNTSDNDSYTIENIPFVQGHFYYVKIDSVPEGYSFNSRSSYLNGIHGDGILSGVQSYNVTVSKTPTLDSLVKFPESDSYPAKFTIIDEESKEVVKGLDIELYTLDSYSVDANLIDKLAEWNTTDSETYSCNLPYSFENQDSYSAYGVVIKNMPEGYVYTFSGENSNCFPVDYRPITIWTDVVNGNDTHEHEYVILIEKEGTVHNPVTTKPDSPTIVTTETTSVLPTLEEVVEFPTETTVENAAIYFSYPDSEKGYCTCQIGEKIDLNLENYDLDNNDYEFGVSPIYFRIEDKSIARIDHVQGSTVTITGVSVGETVLKATTPDDQSISIKIIVEESTVITSTATESTTPITTTTINRITDTQAIYDILAAYIEENNINASFAGESKYPEFEGAVVIEFFDNSDKLNQLRDFAYLESNLSANYLQIIPVVNGVAITTRPTDPIEMTTTTTIITEETVSTSKAIANVEITEVTDNTLFVKPVGDSAKLLGVSDIYTLSLQQFKKYNSDIEPVVGMKLEITYDGRIAASYPAKFNDVQKVAVISDDIKIVTGDANCDGELSMADAVLIMQSIANPAKFGIEGTDENHITEQGKKNADIAGENDGITNADALAIQKKLLKLE